MNHELFIELNKIVNVPSMNFYVEDYDFFHFLIGFYEPKYTKNDIKAGKDIKCIDLIIECLDYKKNLRSVFGKNYEQILKLSKKIRIDSLFNSQNLFAGKQQGIKNQILNKNEIKELYHTYFIPSSKYLSSEEKLIALFNFCILDQNENKFSYKKQHIKPTTVSMTFGVDTFVDVFTNHLLDYPKTILFSQHGTGKSRFLQYWIAKWNIEDCYYINYDHSLKNTISQIKYTDYLGNATTDSSGLNLLYKNSLSSLLIIDNMYYTSDFSKNLDWLSKLKIRVIVVALLPVQHKTFRCIDLPALSEDSIIKIFNKISGFNIEDTDLKKRLLHLTAGNPLMISLLAEQCHLLIPNAQVASPLKQKSILNDLMSSAEKLDNHTLYSSTEKYRFKHIYTDKTLDYIGHIKQLFKEIKPYLNNRSNKLIMYLSCFGWSPISLDFLYKIMPHITSDDFDPLVKMGLITQSDRYVHTTSLVSYSTFATINPSPSEIKELIEPIYSFLLNYDETLSVPYLNHSLFTFAQALYNKVKCINNPSQTKTAMFFDQWQELMYQINNYYYKNNEPKLADMVLSLIYYPENLAQSKCFLDRPFLSVSNNLQIETELKNNSDYIDTLISSCNYYKSDKLLDTDTSQFMSNTIDIYISLYFEQFLSSDIDVYTRTKNCCLLSDEIKKILAYFNNTNTKASLSDTKLQLYNDFLTLKFFKNSSDDISPLIFQINKYTSIDCRIRRLTFSIILETVMLATFNTAEIPFRINRIINPMIYMLNNTIKGCMLIPIQTFRLCMYAYISSITILKAYKDSVPSYCRSSLDPFLIKKEHLINLTERCHLTNDFLTNEVTLLDSFSDIIGDPD